MLPRLVQVRGFEDADDIASVLHARVARATARPAGSGRTRTRTPPRFIVGLIPNADGPMDAEMRQALEERRDLIEQRVTTLIDGALTDREPWTMQLGLMPVEEKKQGTWLRAARTVVAYRDRYQITDDQAPLGPDPDSQNVKQRIDAARARAALVQARRIADMHVPPDAQPPTATMQRGLGF
ncbi:hypothetical protein VR010_10745 [Actinomycetaceae bacterium L2_0104]